MALSWLVPADDDNCCDAAFSVQEFDSSRSFEEPKRNLPGVAKSE